MVAVTENRSIWDALERTDPQYTKDFTKGGGFRGTDVNPTWRIQRLTEQFGPQGKGWGWTIHDRWRESYGGVECVFVQVSIWYVLDGTRYEGSPQIGGTDCTRSPDEGYKMAVTDGFGKCAMALGLSADIYLKQFDASKYRQEDAAKAQKRPQNERKPSGPTPTPTEPPSVVPTASAGPRDASGEKVKPSQVSELMAAVRKSGISVEQARLLTKTMTGADHSSEIPADKFERLLTAVKEYR